MEYESIYSRENRSVDSDYVTQSLPFDWFVSSVYRKSEVSIAAATARPEMEKALAQTVFVKDSTTSLVTAFVDMSDMNWTASFDNDSTGWWNESTDYPPWIDPLDGYPYPSLYSWQHIVLSSIVVTLIMLLIVVGNGLVVAAIATDRQLNGLQNWFIASLAISDLFVGLFIMPLSLANELMGYWPFGLVLCELWLSTDVLLCTASILNLVLISLDRYWSITRAVSYVRQRTRRRAMIMIAAVWGLSMGVCLPPLAGWKRPQPNKFGFPLCVLSEEPGYVIYSTMVSFYIPLIVMIIVYFKIYLAARGRARKNLKKPDANHHHHHPQQQQQQQHPIEEHDFKIISTSATTTSLINPPCFRSGQNSDQFPNDNLTPTHEMNSDVLSESPQPTGRQHGDTLFVVTDDICELGPEIVNKSDDQYGVVDDKSRRSRGDKKSRAKNACSGSGSRRGSSGKRARHQQQQQQQQADRKSNGAAIKDVEFTKRKLARARERRATVVLGIVMASFIGCWLPFFSLYPITLMFGFELPASVFAVIFWLGYCNSALNPIIYTIFNREFRQAFKKIVFRKPARRF